MISKILIILIGFYQKYLSFDRGLLMVFAPTGACRQTPSCSEYTKRAIAEQGSLKGIYLGLKRIAGCR